MENVSPVYMNQQQRAAVIGMGQKMTQRIGSQVVNPLTDPIVNIQPRNVGLVTGFIVEVEGQVTNGAADVANLTDFGSSNVLKNITFTDLNNVQRINTSGYHMALLNSARQGFGFGGSYSPNLPMNYGNNFGPFKGASSLAAGAKGDVKHTYYVPLAYSSNDLRGAVYANVVNANMQLQLEVNADPFIAANGNQLNAIYKGNNNGFWSSDVTITVYQVYIHQIPMSNGTPVLPMMDLNNIYDIKKTVVTGISQAQDYPVSYANYRAFLSTFAVFDNGGEFNSGSDIDYFALTAANSTNIFKYGPDVAALMARQTFMSDTPPGVYYFDHRDKPLDTITYGNLELTMNAKLVNPNAQLVMLYESFQQTSQIPMSSSLAGGN
jgi:hypothetical protein